MKKKIFTLLTLLLTGISGAWADPVYHDLTDGSPVILTKTYVDAADWIVKGGGMGSTKDLKNKTWYNPSTNVLEANGYSSTTNFYIEKTYNATPASDWSLYLYVKKGLGHIVFYTWCNSSPDGRKMTFTINGEEAPEVLEFPSGGGNAGYVYVNLDKTKDNIIRVNATNELELYAVKGSVNYRTGTSVNAEKTNQKFIAYSGNATGISGSGVDEVTFKGIGTLSGTNMQSGGSNLTVNSKTYSSIKGARNSTYVLTPAEGITITAVKMYTTSNNGTNLVDITTGGVTTNVTKTSSSSDRGTPQEIDLVKNGSGYFEFTVASTSAHSQNLFVLEITYDMVENVDVAVSSAGYATLYYDKKLAIPTGVKAYTATISGSSIDLTEVADVIPANTGVILEAAQGTYKFLITTAAAPAVGSNILEGTTSEIVTPSGAYTLGQNSEGIVGLRAYSGGKIRAYSAYSTDGSLPAARDFYGFSDDVTAINKVEAKKVENGVFYNLAGQQVAQPTKGLYIVNGKKVIIK